MTEDKMADTIRKIAKNYEELEKSLVNQLQLETPNHQYTTGSYRETVWKELFERVIPKKYCIEQGVFIIDSYGKISSEVDLAVFDEMYTPYIFNYGKIKFIPIEAVSVVIQCKSQISGKAKQGTDRQNVEKKKRKSMYENLREWVDSIDGLKTSLDSVLRTITDLIDNNDGEPTGPRGIDNLAQTSTRPVKILCATAISDPMKKELEKDFDILLYIKNKRLVKEIKDDKNNFMCWYEILNHYGYERYSVDEKYYREKRKKKAEAICSHKALEKRKLTSLQVTNNNGEENIIMSLTFQLNQLLMLINNPMQFPHRAYAKRFTSILGGGKPETEEQ